MLRGMSRVALVLPVQYTNFISRFVIRLDWIRRTFVENWALSPSVTRTRQGYSLSSSSPRADFIVASSPS